MSRFQFRVNDYRILKDANVEPEGVVQLLFYIVVRAVHLHYTMCLWRSSPEVWLFSHGAVFGMNADIKPLEGFFMNYKKNYDDYISYVKTLNRKKLDRSDPDYVYYECHHIIPRCMGGVDNTYNLVLLTAREHYLAHYLLTKIYPCISKLVYAFWAVCTLGGLCLSSRGFERLRRDISQKMSLDRTGRPSPNKGKPSKTIGMKKPWVSLALKGRKRPDISELMSKRVFSTQHRRLIGEANSRRIWTDESRSKKAKASASNVVALERMNIARSIKVKCVETDRIFSSMTKASEWVRSLGGRFYSRTYLWSHLNDKVLFPFYGGYTWETV